MYKVEVHILFSMIESTFWVYNAQVTQVLSTWCFFNVMGAVVFVPWHPTYRSGSQNEDCIQLFYGLGEFLAIEFGTDITGTGTVPS